MKYFKNNVFLPAIMLVTLSCGFEKSPGELPSWLPDRLPHQSPEQWLLGHIDVETTGLIPGYHEMIDIGLVYTDLDGRVLDSLFLRLQPQHPERLDPGAYRVNAFDPARWKKLGALDPRLAVDSIRKFHQKAAGDRSVMLVAYNSYFDAAFLDHLFRSTGGSWRELYYYFILDIPSMAWALGFKDITSKTVLDYFNLEDEPTVPELHTGITGAVKNVKIYQSLINYGREVQGDG